jgi:lipoteichoic acid synthase
MYLPWNSCKLLVMSRLLLTGPMEASTSTGRPFNLSPTIPVVAAAGAAALISAALRVHLIYYGDASAAIQGIKNSVFDQLLIAGTAAVWAFAALLVRRRPRSLKIVNVSYITLCLVIVIAGCINVEAIKIIGGALTFQWLYYADLLRSFTSQSAVIAALNPAFFKMLAVCLVSFPILYWLVRIVLVRARNAGLLVPALGLGIALFAGFVWKSSNQFHATDRWRGAIVNPIVEIVSTALSAGLTDPMKDPSAIAPAPLPAASSDAALLPVELRGSPVHNVVMIVMESVGANHVAGFTGPRAASWTPVLAGYAPRSLRFQNIYSHTAHSSKSLFSLLTGRLPLFSYQLEWNRLDERALSSLSSVLAAGGYRTAFFMSGDLAFQSADRFVSRQGFSTIRDMTTIRCDRRYDDSTAEWQQMAVDDSCTADVLNRWIAADATHPFFAVFWTGNTHWPYYSRRTPSPGAFSADERENRYVAALRETDQAVGAVLKQLESSGLLDSTLVVVLGDHGEAFGEHEYRGHANSIYEEAVHIPLVLISGRIRSSDDNRLGALSDVAPTILHILGRAPPQDWDGRSLFDTHRPPAVFMFSPNHDLTVGYREGSRKFMLQVARNRAYVFDIRRDPAERFNLAGQDSAQEIRHRVAGRLQAQDQVLAKLLR